MGRLVDLVRLGWCLRSIFLSASKEYLSSICTVEVAYILVYADIFDGDNNNSGFLDPSLARSKRLHNRSLGQSTNGTWSLIANDFTDFGLRAAKFNPFCDEALASSDFCYVGLPGNKHWLQHLPRVPGVPSSGLDRLAGHFTWSAPCCFFRCDELFDAEIHPLETKTLLAPWDCQRNQKETRWHRRSKL